MRAETEENEGRKKKRSMKEINKNIGRNEEGARGEEILIQLRTCLFLLRVQYQKSRKARPPDACTMDRNVSDQIQMIHRFDGQTRAQQAINEYRHSHTRHRCALVAFKCLKIRLIKPFITSDDYISTR